MGIEEKIAKAKVAHWYSEDDDECRCSICKHPVHLYYNHLGEVLLPVRCPKCGAFMRDKNA